MTKWVACHHNFADNGQASIAPYRQRVLDRYRLKVGAMLGRYPTTKITYSGCDLYPDEFHHRHLGIDHLHLDKSRVLAVRDKARCKIGAFEPRYLVLQIYLNIDAIF